MKGGDILDFWKGGDLRKGGGVDLEKGGMTPLTNYADTNLNYVTAMLQLCPSLNH